MKLLDLFLFWKRKANAPRPQADGKEYHGWTKVKPPLVAIVTPPRPNAQIQEYAHFDIDLARRQWLRYAVDSSVSIARVFTDVVGGCYLWEDVKPMFEKYNDLAKEAEYLCDTLVRQGLLPQNQIVFPKWGKFLEVVASIHCPGGWHKDNWRPMRDATPRQVREYLWQLYRDEMNCPDMPREFFGEGDDTWDWLSSPL